MAVSMLAWPVITIASVSGDACLRCSSTSMPVIPGMRKSRMAASKLAFSRALRAALPSGHTVTSCPSRGNSERMNSRSDASSSANRIRRLLCGMGYHLLLDGFSRLQGHAHREGATLVRSRTDSLDLSSVLTDDAMTDG